MKKFLTLKNILICCGLVFALVAFFLSFAASFTVTVDHVRGQLLHIVWGCDMAIYEGHAQSTPYEVGPAVALLLGAIFMLVGALGAAVVGLLVKKPWAKWVVVVLALLVLAGAVMQFFFIRSFANAFGKAMAKAEHMDPKTISDQLFKEFKSGNPSAPIPVVQGILGILAGLGLGAAVLLPEKK